MPDVARTALRTDPDRMVLEIMGLRAYARAKAAYEGQGHLEASARAALLADPMVQLVKAITFDLAQEALDARRAQVGAIDG